MIKKKKKKMRSWFLTFYIDFFTYFFQVFHHDNHPIPTQIINSNKHISPSVFNQLCKVAKM